MVMDHVNVLPQQNTAKYDSKTMGVLNPYMQTAGDMT